MSASRPTDTAEAQAIPRTYTLDTPRRLDLGTRIDRAVPLLMLLPALLIVVGLLLYPLIYNAYTSLLYLTSINFNAGGRFVWVDNFAFLFSDKAFYHSLQITGLYVSASVGLEVAIGFGLALLLYRSRPRLRQITIVGLLLPLMTTPVAAALVWRFMLNYQVGIINYLIALSGFPKVPFTSDLGLALPVVIAIDVWQHLAFPFLVLLAALMSIPGEVLEASAIDGARYIQQVRYVIVPLLRPVFLLVLLFRLMGALQAFDTIFILTSGGPARATEVLSIYLYETTFLKTDFGTGAAISMCILVISSIVSIALIAVMRRRAFA